MQQELPTLTTGETQRLRSDYPCIEHLEAGNVAAWLVERQEQLLVRAKDERTGMNLAKLMTLAGGAVGAICYATSPLAPIGALMAGVGYVWAVAQDMNDSHQFAPIPFVRGNFIEFLSAIGDKQARGEWFASSNELVDLMYHLCPFERYEFALLKEHTHVLSEYLVEVEPGKRFYAYRWLLDWYVKLREDASAASGFIAYLARSPLSKIFGAVPGSGKTTMQRALIKQVVQQFPGCQIYATQTKRDPFLGLERIPGAIVFAAPRRDDGVPILNQAERVSKILEYRSQFPASEAKRLFKDKPVILLLCDYSDSLKQCSLEVRTELLKIVQQILYNGRALNVQVWLDVQVLNLLAAMGLEGSDSRSAAILICLGAERVEEGGDFGVIENAICGSSETFPSGFKAKIKPHLEQFKARSRATQRTLAVTPFMDAGAFLLPDWSGMDEEVIAESLLNKIAHNIQQQQQLLLDNRRKNDIRARLEGLVSDVSDTSETVSETPETPSETSEISETVKRPDETLKRPEDKTFQEQREDEAKRFTKLKLPFKEAKELIVRLRNEMSQTKLIELLWEAKPGESKAYKEAVAEFKELTGEEGEK